MLLCVITHTGIDDLGEVLEFLNYVSDWKRLGLNLGLLLKPTLTDIDTFNRGRPADCKIDMLSAWLEQQDNVSQKGVPSWSVLRAVLQRIGDTGSIVSRYIYYTMIRIMLLS